MSEFRVNTLSDAAGTGPTTLTKQNAAKAFVAYDQVNVTIDTDFNVSSVTDQAAGRFSANHTNNFSSVNEPYTHYSNSGERFIDPTRRVAADAMHCTTRNASSVYADYEHSHLIRVGDLA